MGELGKLPLTVYHDIPMGTVVKTHSGMNRVTFRIGLENLISLKFLFLPRCHNTSQPCTKRECVRPGYRFLKFL